VHLAIRARETSLSLFLDSIAAATGVVTVPLHSSFFAFALLYGACWRQPYVLL
jgi:hypothetical protein